MMEKFRVESFAQHLKEVAPGQGWRYVQGKGMTKQWAWKRSWVSPLFKDDVDACYEIAEAYDRYGFCS